VDRVTHLLEFVILAKSLRKHHAMSLDMDTKTELKKVCFLLLALSTVISVRNYNLGYTWYSEIYHNTILYIWKIVINQKQWTPCWLIVLLSPWNPFKMQFTCKFDYHHNIKHILNISALAQALSCKSILFEKLILLYGKYIHTVRSTEAYGH